MSDNYAVINGEKVELTDEQVKALGIERRKPLFDKVNVDDEYYFVGMFGDVAKYTQYNDTEDDALFNNCNYFNDELFANQVALHQLLYRKLLKFAYNNGYADNQIWDDVNQHWAVEYLYRSKIFIPYQHYARKSQGVYFSSKEGAERAIEKVVEPFMEEHPDFIW